MNKKSKTILALAKIMACLLGTYLLFAQPAKALQAQEESALDFQTIEQPETVPEMFETIWESQETDLQDDKMETCENSVESAQETLEMMQEEPDTELDGLQIADLEYSNIPNHEHEYYYAGFCENEGELWCCSICMDSIIKPCSHRQVCCEYCGEELGE